MNYEAQMENFAHNSMPRLLLIEDSKVWRHKFCDRLAGSWDLVATADRNKAIKLSTEADCIVIDALLDISGDLSHIPALVATGKPCIVFSNVSRQFVGTFGCHHVKKTADGELALWEWIEGVRKRTTAKQGSS